MQFSWWYADYCVILSKRENIVLFLLISPPFLCQNVKIFPIWSVFKIMSILKDGQGTVYVMINSDWILYSFSPFLFSKEFLSRVCPVYSGGIRHQKSQLIDWIVSKCLCKASERERARQESSQDPSVTEYAQGGIGFVAATMSLKI